MANERKVRHKLPLSGDHLASAVLAATRARDLENGTQQPVLFHVKEEVTAAAIACVISSVAYLEADINEFFSHASEERHAFGVANNPVVLDRIRQTWNIDQRGSVLDKYNLALALCDQATFDRGAMPYSAAALLVRLRNALVHFKPGWEPGGGSRQEADEVSRLSRSLMQAFPENSLAESYQPYFVQRCLGYGSSKWAVTSSVALVTEFMTRLGAGFSPTYLLPFIAKL